jgi:predicted nuclease of predicted toxin-antitoxin system
MGSLASELRPIAAELAAAPRVYVDANLPLGSVSFMRHDLRWDVLFVLEHEDLRRAPDREHFRRALELGRTLITMDHDFFDDRRFPLSSSPGVVICSAPDEAALKRLLKHLDATVLRAEGRAAQPLKGHKIEMTSDVISRWPDAS